ncbi:MAG: response regulator, partial [Candidatus Omnitrophota bacterium]
MLAKKKILIVDDEKDMRDALAYRLKGSGYEVIMAENGAQGLELASKEHPDLIVLDMMMPVLNGFEAYKQIKLK